MMDKDLERIVLFAQNNNVILPYDKDTLPVSVGTDNDIIYWIGFESRELGLQSPSLDPSFYNWGQISGFQYLKFLHERIEAGGKHVLLINPDTERQFALTNYSISDFLHWLEENPLDSISV